MKYVKHHGKSSCPLLTIFSGAQESDKRVAQLIEYKMKQAKLVIKTKTSQLDEKD